MKRFVWMVGVLGALASPAVAEPAVGTWLSPPDGKGQVGHVEVAPCGNALCGTLVTAFAPSGEEVVTPNVGKRLFWDMQAQGGGDYGGGTVYVPKFDQTYAAQMTLESADRLKVRGCVGPICKGQVWRRAR